MARAWRRAALRPDVNTVFQDYALFPHMSVSHNVAYGLRVRGVAEPSGGRGPRRCWSWCARRLRRSPPGPLSGGQRQRVALARALINRPEVLLLDEPLGALDLKLRQQMQTELKALQRKVGITFVYVTHDQEEALGMSDRLAVFNHGRVEQIGTPEAIYEHPATAFVAGFVGASNIVDAATAARLVGRAQAFALRPERIRILDPVDGAAEGLADFAVEGTLTGVQYHGASTRLEVALDGTGVLIADRANAAAGGGRPEIGARVRLGWAASAMQALQDGARRAARGRRAGAGARRAVSALTPGLRSPPAAPTAIADLDLLYRRPGLSLLLLLAPPLLWLGVVYLGSLFALLIQSFYHFDDFTGQVVRSLRSRPTRDLFTRANLDIVARTRRWPPRVTVAAALLGFPARLLMARHAPRPRTKALFYLAVMMPLWSSYLVRIYAWKLILAKEGILSWFFARPG